MITTVKIEDNILDLCSQYPKLKDQLQLKLTENHLAQKYYDHPKYDLTVEQIQSIRRKMRCIEDIINSHSSLSTRRNEYRTDQERLFLKNYYILGLTLEKTAEAMNTSRDTVCRIRKRLAMR